MELSDNYIHVYLDLRPSEYTVPPTEQGFHGEVAHILHVSLSHCSGNLDVMGTQTIAWRIRCYEDD